MVRWSCVAADVIGMALGDVLVDCGGGCSRGSPSALATRKSPAGLSCIILSATWCAHSTRVLHSPLVLLTEHSSGRRTTGPPISRCRLRTAPNVRSYTPPPAPLNISFTAPPRSPVPTRGSIRRRYQPPDYTVFTLPYFHHKR